jgi:SSS family solute:Na+ symporter
VFTLLVAGLYWRRANAWGAYAALVLGAVGPLTFLVVNTRIESGPLVLVQQVMRWLIELAFGVRVDYEHQIAPEVAGAGSFALAFLGMIVGTWIKNLGNPPGGSLVTSDASNKV